MTYHKTFYHRLIGLLILIALCQRMGNAYAESMQDVWLVDTHCVSWTNGGGRDFQNIAYFRLHDNHWIRSDAEAFFSTQNHEIPLIVFSPGYTATTESTIEVGMTLLHICKQSVGDTAVRIVFWNWPAQKEVIGLRRDIRAKIPIAQANARYLAMFLQNLQPNSKVCVLGFSFGTRLIGDAVELMGENRPDGMRLHLVLAGAATDSHWLAANGRNRSVPRLADKILIFYNPEDFRLQFYPLMYDCGYRPQALGRFGPPMASISPEFRHKIESVNLNPSIGIRHSTLIHFRSFEFKRRIGEYLFFQSQHFEKHL